MVINFTEATYRPSVFFFYFLSYISLLLPFVIHVFFEFLFISLCFSSPSYAAFLFIHFPASISSMFLFLFYFNSMPFFVRRFILRRLTNTVPRAPSFICRFFKSSSFSNTVFANLTAGYGTATDVTIH